MLDEADRLLDLGFEKKISEVGGSFRPVKNYSNMALSLCWYARHRWKKIAEVGGWRYGACGAGLLKQRQPPPSLLRL